MLTYTTDQKSNTLHSDQDARLLSTARFGDSRAFGVFFELNKDAVYSFVLRTIGNKEDAEDIVQQTFISAWRSIGSFRGESKVFTWLLRIAANLCADRARRLARGDGRVGSLYDEYICDERTIDFEERNSTRMEIDIALGKLPLNHRMLVVLCDIQGFSSKEAAEILHCSPISVRVRLSRAHSTLRRLLSDTLEGLG